MQVNIKHLIDDGQCYKTVRELRWPEGIPCPSCQSKHVIKRGCDDKELARQRYACKDGSATQVMLTTRFRATVGPKPTRHPGGQQQP